MNGLPRNVRRLEVGPLGANCYIFSDPGSLTAAVIDPGGDGEKIARLIERDKLEAALVINTHAHIDHIGANRFLVSRFRVPLAVHALDAEALLRAELNLEYLLPDPIDSPAADRLLEDGDEIEVGGSFLRVIHTPGHTPGGICLYCENPSGPGLVFTGDTLFAAGIGRTDFPGGSLPALLDSIRRRVFSLPPETLVLPGHGPATTVGREKGGNPFL